MDLINIIIAIGIITNFTIGLLTHFHNKGDKLSVVYNLLVLSVIFWSLGMIFFRLSGEETKIIWMKLLYITGNFSVYAFLYFALIFPDSKSCKKIYSLLIIISVSITTYLVGATDLFVKDALLIKGGENQVVFGSLYLIYVILVILPVITAFYIFAKKFYHYSSRSVKTQIFFILLGYFIVANTSFVTNLTMPWLGNHSLLWVGQVSIMFMVAIMSYAILKHHLFNIKVITTELLTFTVWLVTLFKVFKAETLSDRLLEGSLFIVVIFLDILIIRSALKEAQTRERIEKLAKELKASNQMKSEFMNLASHQLRTPLTTIKGFASNLIENSYGKINIQQKEAVSSINTSTTNMSNLIEDMLNASRIERKKGFNYVFQIGNPLDLVKEVVNNLTVTAQNKGLKLKFTNKLKKDIKVEFDKHYLRQVISNIIQNAIKYTPKGNIEITIYTEHNKTNELIISVKDTGYGMTQKDIQNLFKRFFRSEHIKKQITDGTGLGLYLAEKIINDHHGKIWVESEALGKGSAFYVSLLLL